MKVAATPLRQGISKERETFNLVNELRQFVAGTVLAASFTWNPPNVPGASTVDTTLVAPLFPTLGGLVAGMPIYVTPPSSLNPGLTATAWVAADNTLTVRLANVTAGPIDPVAGTWSFLGVII